MSNVYIVYCCNVFPCCYVLVSWYDDSLTQCTKLLTYVIRNSCLPSRLDLFSFSCSLLFTLLQKIKDSDSFAP